jgi:hypothetical protein
MKQNIRVVLKVRLKHAIAISPPNGRGYSDRATQPRFGHQTFQFTVREHWVIPESYSVNRLGFF